MKAREKLSPAPAGKAGDRNGQRASHHECAAVRTGRHLAKIQILRHVGGIKAAIHRSTSANWYNPDPAKSEFSSRYQNDTALVGYRHRVEPLSPVLVFPRVRSRAPQ